MEEFSIQDPGLWGFCPDLEPDALCSAALED